MKWSPLLSLLFCLQVMGAWAEPVLPVTPRALNLARLNCSFENLKNQFTPGYKAREVTLGMEEFLDPSPGKIFKTKVRTNVAVEGDGWLLLTDGDRRFYSKDGRLELMEGGLRHVEGYDVLAYPLNAQGEAESELHPIKLDLDPQTKLYLGTYYDFRFDSAGRLYGLGIVIDPVTGARIEISRPLYQLALAAFPRPHRLVGATPTLVSESADSGRAVVGVAGEGVLGQVRAEHLELSNVDFMREASTIGMVRALEQHSTLSLYGDLSSLSLEILQRHGISVARDGPFLKLEATSSKVLLHGLSEALEQGPQADQAIVRELMMKADPRLVIRQGDKP